MAQEVEVRIIKSITIDVDILRMYLGAKEDEAHKMLDTFQQLSTPEQLDLSSLPSIPDINNSPSDMEKLRNLLIYIADQTSDDGELVEFDVLPS